MSGNPIRVAVTRPNQTQAQVGVTTARGVQGPPGPRGPAGVVVSDTQPSDTSVVWIDTSGLG